MRGRNVFYCTMMLLFLTIIACTRDDAPPVVPNIPDTENPDTDSTTQNPPNILPAGWTNINVESGEFFYDVFFTGDTGYCCSLKNLYYSIDGGNSWQKQKSTSQDFFTIGMGSGKNAIVVALGTYNVFVTKNGGIDFDSLAIDDDLISDVFFINSNIAYMAGRKFWKTMDGGYTWKKLSSLNHEENSASLHFVDELHGYLNLSTGIYSTKDGGINWRNLSIGSMEPNGSGAVFFTDTAHGFISKSSGVGRYIQSTSSIQRTKSLGWGYHDIHFTSQDTGYISSGFSILKTTNYGANWHQEFSGDGEIVEIHFTDANHGWAGTLGGIYKYVKP